MKRSELDEQALQALSEYRAGALARAAQLAKGVVDEMPDHADAVHVLGHCLRSQARYAEALQLVDRALITNPGKQKLMLLRGDLLRMLDHIDESVKLFQSILKTHPQQPDAIHGIGCVLAGLRRYGEAIQHFKAAVDAGPKRADLVVSLATALEENNQLQEAARVLENMLTLFPKHTDVLNRLGVVYGKMGRTMDATRVLKTALQYGPDEASIWQNLSIALTLLHDHRGVTDLLTEGHQKFPQHQQILHQLGVGWTAQGEYHKALECIQKLLAINPKHVMGQASLALTQLVLGDWENGWKNYELRWMDPKFKDKHIPQQLRRWNGEPVAGKHILVWGEQGFGDHIQFVRFIRRLADMGARVTFRCVDSLVDLMRSVDARLTIIDTLAPIPTCDYCVPMMSLPLHLKVLPATAGCAVPYIYPSQTHREKWKQEFAAVPSDKLKVGLVWAGAANNVRDYQRSILLKQLLPLQAARPDAVFYSLQKDSPSNQWMEVRKDWPLVDLGQRLHTWQDTAAAIEQLDMVICVDTAVAHLAAAMGKPVWMMISKAPDFRWMLESEATPWYPTMRLYRQQTHRQWDELIARVANDLSTYQAPRA